MTKQAMTPDDLIAICEAEANYLVNIFTACKAEKAESDLVFNVADKLRKFYASGFKSGYSEAKEMRMN